MHFWRSKDKAEVNFVANLGKEIFPIEVKYRKFREPEIERSLRGFIKRFRPRRVLLVNLNLNTRMPFGNTEIIFLPFSEFIMDGSHLFETTSRAF